MLCRWQLRLVERVVTRVLGTGFGQHSFHSFLMGVYMRKLLLAATAAAAIAAPAAAVTIYDFSLSGGIHGPNTYQPPVTWSMPASPTPDSQDGNRALFYNITFAFAGISQSWPIDFELKSGGAGGGFEFSDFPFNSVGVFTSGPELYTGSLDAPTFKTGTFTLTDTLGSQNVTLTISDPSVGAVPEPANWAMLIAGFGLTGAAMRRRRIVAAIA